MLNLQILSKRLTEEFDKGFDVRNLRNMRAFYVCFPIRDAVCAELSWSTRALERQISKLYFERLLSSQDSDPVKAEAEQKVAELEEQQLRPKDVLRDPYVFDFLNLPSQHLLETDLEQGLLDNLQSFLLIDLKLGKLSHQDVGQMDSYVRMYDEHHRPEGDNPSIGLILCSQKS